jgi:hypothetical protein
VAEVEIDLGDLVFLVVELDNEADFGFVGERVGSQVLPRFERLFGPVVPGFEPDDTGPHSANRRAARLGRIRGPQLILRTPRRPLLSRSLDLATAACMAFDRARHQATQPKAQIFVLD